MRPDRRNGLISNRGTVGGISQRLGSSRNYKLGTSKGVIVMPGDTHNQDWWFDLDTVTYEVRYIVDKGFPVASVATSTYWGNSTIRSQISTLKTNAQVSLFASGKVHLLGVSAGGTTVCNWAKNNPTLVQSITLLIPAVDIQAIHAENRGGFSSEINTAYGGAPPDADNPIDYAADLSSIPIQVFYSTTDAITTSNETLSFASDSGATTYSMGALGHFWGLPWNGDAVADFIKAND